MTRSPIWQPFYVLGPGVAFGIMIFFCLAPVGWVLFEIYRRRNPLPEGHLPRSAYWSCLAAVYFRLMGSMMVAGLGFYLFGGSGGRKFFLEGILNMAPGLAIVSPILAIAYWGHLRHPVTPGLPSIAPHPERSSPVSDKKPPSVGE